MRGDSEIMTYYSRQIRALSEALYLRHDLARRVSAARRFMDRHYAEPIDLDAISREACLSRYHFIRVFRRFYGRTPHQYLTEVRVARAKELIRGGMTVRAACFSVGYDSLTSFSSLFRRMTGRPPSSITRDRNIR